MTQQVPQQERVRRQALNRELRWRKGVTPRHMSLMQRRPWQELGISRATWYRHRETDETGGETITSSSRRIEHNEERIEDIREAQGAMLPSSAVSFVQAHSDPVPFNMNEPVSQPAPAVLHASNLVPDTSLDTPTLSATVSMEEWSAADAVDHYAERAAIMEFDGGYSRDDAEAQALDEVIQRFQWSRNAVWWQQFYRLKRGAA